MKEDFFKNSVMELPFQLSNFYVGNRIRDNVTHKLKTVVEVQREKNRIIFDDGSDLSFRRCLLETCLVSIKRYDFIGD